MIGKSCYHEYEKEEFAFEIIGEGVDENGEDTVSWYKINYLSNCREYFISFCKGKKATFNSYYDKAFYQYPIVGGKERTIHPTQKPVDLLKYLIKTYTNEGDVVLDFTMGSGSTGVACLNTGRKFIGIELDEKYYNIALNRMKGEI
mgnify:CR=1 FL=1